MSLQKKKIHILTILFKNLRKTNPQLVSSATIAAQMDIKLAELQTILKSMEGMGVIQSDPDLQFSLITRKGLAWLDEQSSYLHAPRQKESVVSSPRFA
jgi:predicted transcriptional regulator